MAFDGGDDRFRTRFRQRAIGTRPRAIDRALVRHLAEVCPGAEDTARSGQDHGLHFVVSLDCMDGFQEIISRLLVERVPLLWAVDSEVGDLAFDLEIDAGFHDTHSGLSAAQTSTNTV